MVHVTLWNSVMKVSTEAGMILDVDELMVCLDDENQFLGRPTSNGWSYHIPIEKIEYCRITGRCNSFRSEIDEIQPVISSTQYHSFYSTRCWDRLGDMRTHTAVRLPVTIMPWHQESAIKPWDSAVAETWGAVTWIFTWSSSWAMIQGREVGCSARPMNLLFFFLFCINMVVFESYNSL